MTNEKDLYKHLIGCTIITVKTEEPHYDGDEDTLSSLRIKDVNGKEYLLIPEYDCHHGINYIQVDEIPENIPVITQEMMEKLRLK